MTSPAPSRPLVEFLGRQWFLIAILLLTAGGIVFGANADRAWVDSVVVAISPRVVTAIVLFLMAFSLDSRQLGESFRRPAPVLFASAVNFGLIPLLAWPLSLLQPDPDFQIGLLIAAAAPCTMAAASVWTRRAGGNDAVSLLVTVLTNGLCFAITPAWLVLTTGRDIQLDTWAMFVRLLQAALIPMTCGQLVRQLPGPRHVAVKFKKTVSRAAQSCILLLVFTAACRGGAQLSGQAEAPSLGGVSLVWGCCIAVHLAAMAAGFYGARLIGFAAADVKAVAFASSQKTLPIGVLLATDPAMFGNPDLLATNVGVPFAVFPILMYHTSQLFIDTPVADRLALMDEPAVDAGGSTVVGEAGGSVAGAE